MSSISSHSAGGGKGAPDPNGMERLPGESDAEYIARQTRLRDEAKARMAAKFGGGGMGGVGSGGE
jgi:ADP-ribosylation factor GTPase-activating protein 1